MLEHYLIPLAPYLLLALAAMAGLFLFASLEREIRHLKSRLHRQTQGELVSQEELQIRLEGLNERLREAEERASIPVQAASIKPSLNLNKRTQALRMSRRGAPPTNIAAALSLPRKEVELLLKIERLTLTNAPES
jgi:hypothetical protein